MLAGAIGASAWPGALAATGDPNPDVLTVGHGHSLVGKVDENRETDSAADEIWYVSARSINRETTDLSELKVEVFGDGCWAPSSLSRLLESHRNDTVGQTVLYVHGNRTDEYYAKCRGRQVFRNLFAGWRSPRPPVRFVIWAWHSDRDGHGASDFSIKSQRAVRLGSIFSATVAAFDSDRPPLIIGYSLGCQVIAKAFTYDSLSLAKPCYRLALIAPVLDCRFSCREARNPQPCESIQQSIVLFNQKDIVTCLARRICARQSGNQFRSFEQWVKSPSLPLGPVERIDITAASSCQHSIIRYSAEACVKRSVRSLFEKKNSPLAGAE